MKRQKILIADDDVDFTDSSKVLLESNGFDTLVAHDGARTMKLAHREKPDLILLDLQMPAGTGITVLASLRLRNETSKLPIIVVSGYQKSDVEEEVCAAGANSFIQKPFVADNLLNKIRSLLH